MPADSVTDEKKKVRLYSQTAVRVIFLIMLLDVIGLSLLFPVTAYIVQRYSSEALMVSMMTIIYAAAQFFAAPALGKISDRYGRRPVLLVSVLGSAIGYLIFGIGGSLAVLFISRLIDGISAGNMSTAAAYLADVSPPETRAKNFGLIGIAWGVGLIVGPAIGSAASQISLESPAFAAASLSMLALLLAYFYLPESLRPEERDTRSLVLNDFNPVASVWSVLRMPSLTPVLIALALFNFAFNGMNNMQTLFLIQKFKVEAWQNGLLLVGAGIIVAVIQFTLIQPAVRRFGERTVASLSLLAQAVIAIAIFMAPTFGILFVIALLATTASSFTFPTLTTLGTNRVQPASIGQLMGVTTAIGSLMNIFGPLFAGIVYRELFQGASYWLSAGAFLLAALIVLQARPVKIQIS